MIIRPKKLGSENHFPMTKDDEVRVQKTYWPANFPVT
jgi:hypothetical protein